MDVLCATALIRIMTDVLCATALVLMSLACRLGLLILVIDCLIVPFKPCYCYCCKSACPISFVCKMESWLIETFEPYNF